MKFANEYDGIVCSSGGGGGYGILGVLHTFYTKKNPKTLRYFIGTSAGAIICLFLSIGMTPLELFSKLCSNDINQYLDIVFDMDQVSSTFGLIDFNKIRFYFQTLVIEKLGHIPTFLSLKTDFGKTFVCNSYNLTKNKKVYFSPKTTPDISIVDAMLCSCCIPFLFTKCELDGDLYMDGASFDRCAVGFSKQLLEDEVFPFYKLCVLFCCKQTSNQPKNESQTEWKLIDYIKSICFMPISSQPQPVSEDCVDVFELENDFNDITVKVDTKDRISLFSKNSDQAKQYL
jgi:hypothetical protein